MNCTRNAGQDRVNWVDTKNPTAIDTWIVRFVRGLRGSRQNPVNTKQVLKHFSNTPAAFVESRLDALSDQGKIRIVRGGLKSGRRFNGAYYWVIND